MFQSHPKADFELGPVLFTYHSTTHDSTGDTHFVLVYGKDSCMPALLHFSAPAVLYPIVATEYAKGYKRTGR